ncbi:MAG: hypothetical protein JSV77_01560 [Dehalococcoidales bacterium]|nr:MAG: hypothetical protein JSV77_01560 [Dehalococcoidales bacterium]
MRWTTLIGVNDTIRTGLLEASVAARIIKSRGKLSPYIIDWSYLLDSTGCIVIKLNVAILNRSQSDEMVSQALLAAREDRTITLTPVKLRTAWQGNARIRLDDRRVFDICGKDEILTLPSTVASGAIISGWLAFVIEAGQVELAKQHEWCVAVVDQDGRQYKSRAEQDQTIG